MSQNILLIQSDPADARRVREALTLSGDGLFHDEWVGTCADGLAQLAK